MTDLHRYKGLLIVLAGLYCAVALSNAALLAGLGKHPAAFDHPDRQLAWSPLEEAGAQVSGVELQMRRGGLDDQPAFGIVLGQSTALRGIDPVRMEQMGSPSMRWLLLNGFGSSFVKLHYYAQTLLASELKPRVVVLALHETMLAGQDSNVQIERDYGVWRVAKQLAMLHWIQKQRRHISHYSEMELFELRLSMHHALNSGAAGLFEPADEPWRIQEQEQVPFDKSKQAAHWRRFGWFKPETYSKDNEQADAFRALIEGIDGLGEPQIVIVRMPVSSDLRGWLPSEADARMRALIDEISAGRSVRVLDMRESMPDESFSDYAHLTPAGREVFTGLLADQMNRVDGDH